MAFVRGRVGDAILSWGRPVPTGVDATRLPRRSPLGPGADVIDWVPWTTLVAASSATTIDAPMSQRVDLRAYRFVKIGGQVADRTGGVKIVIGTSVAPAPGETPLTLLSWDFSSGWQQEVLGRLTGDGLGAQLSWSLQQATGAWSITFRLVVIGVR